MKEKSTNSRCPKVFCKQLIVSCQINSGTNPDLSTGLDTISLRYTLMNENHGFQQLPSGLICRIEILKNEHSIDKVYFVVTPTTKYGKCEL